ncbi:hypothetical protein ElyMa_006039000 [Elysia marginata]|uniref:Uncharacterized protein n=1 Tax=Elysia marginata TaxID=1093978 RepID=A0AAV4GLC3_9GAST|nr:hypothetical protein ElyMa_006039000 [Elysia marginata]
MRVTAGFTAWGKRRPVSSTRSLRQVSPGRREDSDPQQSGSVTRTSGCQDAHLTRTAKVFRPETSDTLRVPGHIWAMTPDASLLLFPACFGVRTWMYG